MLESHLPRMYQTIHFRELTFDINWHGLVDYSKGSFLVVGNNYLQTKHNCGPV